jgi:hypothetical protein
MRGLSVVGSVSCERGGVKMVKGSRSRALTNLTGEALTLLEAGDTA